MQDMTREGTEMFSIEEMCKKLGLSQRTRNALLRSNVFTSEDLAIIGERIQYVLTVGKKTYGEVMRLAEACGIELTEEGRKRPTFSRGEQVISLMERDGIPAGTLLIVHKIEPSLGLPDVVCREAVNSRNLHYSVTQVTKYKENKT